MTDKNPVKLFESQKDWEAWLEVHCCDVGGGVWLKIAKKNAGSASVSYQDAVESALMYGWIDGLVKKYDDMYYLQRFTPRRIGSVWSKINVEKINKLEAAGKLKLTGRIVVESAKKDGRWAAAYDSVSKIQTPSDFRNALNANPQAKSFYETLDRANIYAILWRLQTIKNSENRPARIEKFISMLEKGEKIHK